MSITKEKRDHYIACHKDDILKAAYRFAVLTLHRVQWSSDGMCQDLDPETADAYALHETKAMAFHAREWIRLLAAPVDEADMSPLDQVKGLAANARERAVALEAEAKQQRALADALDAATKQVKGRSK
jgi:hypothetical protein